jgi:hypothetical protein
LDAVLDDEGVEHVREGVEVFGSEFVEAAEAVAERVVGRAEMSSWLATLPTAPWRSPCPAAISWMSRTARSFNSGGYRRWTGWDVVRCSAMTPSSSQEGSLHQSQYGSDPCFCPR